MKNFKVKDLLVTIHSTSLTGTEEDHLPVGATKCVSPSRANVLHNIRNGDEATKEPCAGTTCKPTSNKPNCVDENFPTCRPTTGSPQCPCPSKQQVCEDKNDVSCKPTSKYQDNADHTKQKSDKEQKQAADAMALLQLKKAIGELQQKQYAAARAEVIL